MRILEVFILALILALDAFVVSFSYGLCDLAKKDRAALLLSVGTGFFQFMMPLLGAVLALFIFDFIEIYANYIAGIIFIVLGVKLFIDSINKNSEITCSGENLTIKVVFAVSVATSIDAFAAGSSLYLLDKDFFDVFLAAVIIGIVTFGLSLSGFYFGHFLKSFKPDLIGKLGGVLLFLYGIKTIFL